MEKDEERGGNGAAIKGSGVATPFEDAVAMTGVGRFHYILLTVCGFCLISMLFEIMAVAYILPAAQCDFEMSSFEKGFLTGVIYVGMSVSSHMWGFLSDTRGRRLVLLISLSGNFVCSVVASLMPTLPLLIFVRFLNGIFICGPSAVSYAYIGEFHSNRTRALAIIYVTIFIAFGSIADPGIAWAVIPLDWSVQLPWIRFGAWRAFFILSALPSGITFLGLWLLLPESPKFLLAHGSHDEALAVLRDMFASNNGLPPEKYPVVALQTDPLTSSPVGMSPKSPLAVARLMWRQTAPLFQPPYLLYTVVACLIQFGLYVSSNGLLMWLPELLNRVGQYNDAFPHHPAVLCHLMAVLAGQAPAPVVVGGLPGSFNGTDPAALTDAVFAGNRSSADLMAEWSSALADAETFTAVNSSAVVRACSTAVNPTSFQNTLITGVGFTVAYIGIVPLVKYFSKKYILFFSLVCSGCCGLAILWAQTETEVLVLPLLYTVLSGMCVSVVNVVVVDTVPTYLRGMAVCLSLSCGRLGTFITTMVLGALIDSYCVVAISLIGAYVIVCGFLSLLLPSESQLKKFSQ